MMNSSQAIACLLLVFAFTLPLPAQQDDTTKPKTQSTEKKEQKQKAKRKQKTKKVPVSTERKAELLEFVREHHPELESLIDRLGAKKHGKRYANAMRGLDKAAKRLETIKERNPKRYETALKQWKLESRIKVAAAKISLKDSDEIRKELESLVSQLFDHNLERLKNDRENIQQRLKKLDQKIAETESSRSQTIERRIEQLSGKKKVGTK